jgi:hypothetical protein
MGCRSIRRRPHCHRIRAENEHDVSTLLHVIPFWSAGLLMNPTIVRIASRCIVLIGRACLQKRSEMPMDGGPYSKLAEYGQILEAMPAGVKSVWR